MAALPADVAFLLQHAEENDCVPKQNITCQFADNKTIIISKDNLIKYLTNPEYIGKEIITYRGIKIATWFNSNTGCFEGEIMFMNHQLDILAKQEHSLFEHVYYKYFLQKNDIVANPKLIIVENTKEKTFKLRCYVIEMLVQSINTILSILQKLPVDDTQFNFIASHFK